jgi:hypothetical protein
MRHYCCKRELIARHCSADLICFRISHIPYPEDDVICRIVYKCLDFGGKEGVADERGGVVVLGGEEDDKKEFEVFLC